MTKTLKKTQGKPPMKTLGKPQSPVQEKTENPRDNPKPLESETWSDVQKTRAGRMIKKPSRFDSFVTKK